MSSKFAQATAAAKEVLINQRSESADSSGSEQGDRVNVQFIKQSPQVDITAKPIITAWQDDTALLLSLDVIDVEIQIRRSFDEVFIKNLAANIKEHGQLQAVNVTKLDNGRYRLNSGENRFRAISYLHECYPTSSIYQAIRVTVDHGVDDTDRVLKQFHENVQRNELNLLDEARAIAHLRDVLGLKTERDIAAALHIPQKRVNRRLTILAQPEAVQIAVAAGEISLRDLERGNVEIVDGLVVNGLNDGSSALNSQLQDCLPKKSTARKKVVRKKNTSPNISLPFSTVENMVTLLASLAEHKGLAPIDLPINAKGKDLAAILALRLNDIKGAIDASH